jgi:predicted cupin superfamily sugar epimerase
MFADQFSVGQPTYLHSLVLCALSVVLVRVRSMLRSIWEFIVQPTEPIEMWPTSGNVAVVAPRPPPAIVAAPAAAGEAASAAALRSRNGLWEVAGLVGAVVLCQTISWALDRWHKQSNGRVQDGGTNEREANEQPSARIAQLVRELQLDAHPEGGFYRRVYASPWQLRDRACLELSAAASAGFGTPATAATAGDPVTFPRALCSSIYFLLTAEHPTSHLHRLCGSDEQWMHLEGDPLIIVQVDAHTGEYSERVLGPVQSPFHDNPLEHDAQDMATTLFVQPCSSAPAAVGAATPSAVSSPVDALLLRQSSSSPSAGRGSSLSHPSHVVPAGVWFGARLVDDADFAAAVLSSPSASISTPVGGAAAARPSHPPLSLPRRRHGYCLVSCVVNPAFLSEEFELMQPDELARMRTVEHMQQQIQRVRQTAAAAAGTAAVMSPQWEQTKVDRLRNMVLREQAPPLSSSVAASGLNAQVD